MKHWFLQLLLHPQISIGSTAYVTTSWSFLKQHNIIVTSINLGVSHHGVISLCDSNKLQFLHLWNGDDNMRSHHRITEALRETMHVKLWAYLPEREILKCRLPFFSFSFFIFLINSSKALGNPTVKKLVGLCLIQLLLNFRR